MRGLQIEGQSLEEFVVPRVNDPAMIAAAQVALGHFNLAGGKALDVFERGVLATYDRHDQSSVEKIAKTYPELACCLHLVWKVPGGVPFVESLATGEDIKRQANVLGWKGVPNRDKQED